MGYEKQNFQSGQILRAEHMNHVENGMVALWDAVDGHPLVVCTAEGENINLTDSSNNPLKGLRLFGKSTQDGIPTLANPIDIVSIGDDGPLGVTVGTSWFALEFANSFRGVKVNDRTLATYIGSDGIMRCADEVDFERKVRIQRVKRFDFAVSNMNNLEDYPGWKGVTSLLECFPVGTNSWIECVSNIGTGAVINTSSTNLILYLDIKKYKMTQTEWKATYPNLVCTFLFPLITPIETPLIDEELAAYKDLRTSKPNTIVLNDSGAYMSVEYIADTKAYIDNKAAGIITATVE